MKVLTNAEYRYFVNPHLVAENEHSVNSYEIKKFIATMHLAEDIRKQACKLVNKIFELFIALVDMLVNFAEEYNRPLAKVSNTPTPPQSIGEGSVCFTQMRGGVLIFDLS